MKPTLFINIVNQQPYSAYKDGSGFTLADGMYIPEVFVRTIIIIILFYIFASFLLTLVRILLNYRLKSKMIRMGITSDEAKKMLNLGIEQKDHAVKWCLLLLSAAIAFALISRLPFGWLSVATITLSLSLGYVAYYIYLKNKKDKP
ncbi:hypothetical protein [Parapedobacter sp. DT-150]|uniref:hypothetical protein n=1 Tax=Parapedobacter sp. DT-150 TaxID=3396162 RepID=UPI003F1E31C0